MALLKLKYFFCFLSVAGHQMLNDGKSAQGVPCNISRPTTKLPLEKILNSVNVFDRTL